MEAENNILEINKEALKILECLRKATKEVRIDTNNGGLHIDSNTLNFTYIGKFGNNILHHCIQNKIKLTDLDQKLFVTAEHIIEYSMKIGGVTVSTI